MPFLNFDNAQIYYEVVGQGQAFVMLHAGIAHSAMSKFKNGICSALG